MPAVEGLQALECGIDLGQRAVAILAVAVGMELGYRPSPSGFQLIGPGAGRQAQSAEVGEGAGRGVHEASGQKL